MAIDDIKASDNYYRYRYCAERSHYEFLAKAEKCDNFFLGLQWDEKDINALKLQRRPAMTINKIMSTISTIMGEQIYNRNEVLFRPSTGGNPATAEALSKVWMQIAQNNQLNWVRSDVFADGIIRSRGFYDVRMDFNDAMQGEVRIRHLNSKNVIIDPDAEEYDPDLWSDVFITKWLNYQDISLLYSEEDAKYLRDRAESLFPYAYDSIDQKRDSFSDRDVSSYYGHNEDAKDIKRNIRVLERQYMVLDNQKHFIDTLNGDLRPVPDSWSRDKIARALELAQGQVQVIKKRVKRVKFMVTADHVVLHDDWSPYKHFTVVPYFPHFRHGKTSGVVEHLVDPQEVLNKVTSQELHVVNTTANSGWMVKTGALRNMSIEELEQNGAQTGLVLELDDIGMAQKIQPNQTPSGLDRISYKAEEHIKVISNVSDSMQGFDRGDVAAKAIAYKQQRGAVNLTKVLDNLERTDFILARNVLDLIQGYYTEHRILNITHDDVAREMEQVPVNEFDPVSGEIVNDLTLGEYNIVITSTPYRASMEDSQFEQARALREIGVPIPDSVLIENSRLLRRSEIVKQMAGDQESPQAKAKMELDMRNAQAEVAQKEAQVQETLADTQLKQARAQKELSEIQGGGEDGQGEQAVEVARLTMEQQKLEREFELKRWQLEQEMELKRSALAQEFELKREAQVVDTQIRREEAAQEAELRRQQQYEQRAQQVREMSAPTHRTSSQET